MENESRVGRVREELIKNKTPIWRLHTALDMSRREVFSAVRNIGQTYEAILPPQHVITFPETSKEHFEFGELSKLVDPYVDMGMTGAEVQVAVFLETGIKLSKSQSRDAANKSRSRGKVRPLLPEEKAESSNNSHISAAEIQQKVLLWLDSARVARILDKEEDLTDRTKWSAWIEYCIEHKYITFEGLDSRIQTSDNIAASKKRK